MGYGGYSYEAHQAITTARAALPAQEVFSQRSCHPLMDPLNIKLRQSCASANHPNPTSIIFALDVSGSMGTIPDQIARKELPTFMKALLDAGVTDPQVLFMAIQDCAGGVSPLQVSQFESTAELMDQWLTRCWIMGGGASAYESYDLGFYFAARRTRLDSFDKFGKKGYLFMTGDEPSYATLNAKWVQRFIGDELPKDLPLSEVIQECGDKFNSFFLVPDPGRGKQVSPFWRNYLGDQTIVLGDPSDTCAVAAGIVALSEGRAPSLDAVGQKLAAGGLDKTRVARALTAMKPWAETINKS